MTRTLALSTALAITALAARAQAAPLLGQQDVTVLIVATVPPSFVSDATLLQAADLALDEFAYVMEQNSGGRVSFQFDVVGPIRLAATDCDDSLPDTYDRQLQVLTAAVAAVDPGVDFSQVRQLIVLGETGGCNLGNSGYTPRLWPTIVTQEGVLDSSAAFNAGFVGSRPYAHILLHEYAHTVGASHNEATICVDAAGQRVAIDHSAPLVHFQRCQIAPPFWTTFDPMTLGWFHFSAPHKLFWDWFGPGGLIQVLTSGSYTIAATESGPEVATARVLRVPLPASPVYRSYVIEYRGTGEPLTPWPQGLVQTTGVYLHASYEFPNSVVATLLEPPPFVSETEFTTRPLTPGIPFYDAAMGVMITVLATGKGLAQVHVMVPPPCLDKSCYAGNDEPIIDELAPPKDPIVRPPHVDLDDDLPTTFTLGK